MKIALIGYGKMGQMIEHIALDRHHDIVCRIDRQNPEDFESAAFASADVAIEFTRPDQALDNYHKAFLHGIPVVSGTTGWTSQIEFLKQEVLEQGHTLLWASNFSLGMAIFSDINRRLAHIMNAYPLYRAKMSETHHTQKMDAPSGTAITLAKTLIKETDHLNDWTLAGTFLKDGSPFKGGKENKSGENNQEGKDPCASDILPISSFRFPEVPGTHSITYSGEADEITITHKAFNRQGFALGAVLAAEYVAQGHTGWLTLEDVYKF